MDKLTIDLNLDDEVECINFLETYGTLKGRILANRLGFSGKGSSKVATALSNYAWNKKTAIFLRTMREISDAQRYEDICDKIYNEDIKGKINCW